MGKAGGGDGERAVGMIIQVGGRLLIFRNLCVISLVMVNMYYFCKFQRISVFLKERLYRERRN